MNEEIGETAASTEGTGKKSPFSADRYHVKVGGQIIGIYPLDFLTKAIGLKYFSADDYAKRTDETHWRPLRQVPALSDAFEPAKVHHRNTLSQERRVLEKMAGLLGPFRI